MILVLDGMLDLPDIFLISDNINSNNNNDN